MKIDTLVVCGGGGVGGGGRRRAGEEAEEGRRRRGGHYGENRAFLCHLAFFALKYMVDTKNDFLAGWARHLAFWI